MQHWTFDVNRWLKSEMKKMIGKTGGGGGVWIELESPKPPKVEDHYEYWGEAPPERSQRCEYWVRQIERGWRPNRRIPDCYCCGSEWHGVYIWEYLHIIRPLLNAKRKKG